MLKFGHQEYLWAFTLLIPLVLVCLFYFWKRKKTFDKLGKKTLIQRLSPDASSGRKTFKIVLLFVGFIALVIAWANPLMGTKFEKVERNGVDVIFAIDVSKSMLAEDIVPNRILNAKQFVSNVISQTADDRIGLIVFAGNAYLQMPLTVDYSASTMYLKTVDTDIVPTQGTAIGDAIRLAMRSFKQDEDKHKALVIISDGENHEGEAVDAIEDARAQGISIHTIGVGNLEGAKIPEGNGFKTDMEGNIVLTKLNEEMLKDLALQGNGIYKNINDPDVEETILAELASMEGKDFGESVFTEYKNHFPLFLSIAFVILLLDFLISERRETFFKRFSI